MCSLGSGFLQLPTQGAWKSDCKIKKITQHVKDILCNIISLFDNDKSFKSQSLLHQPIKLLYYLH